MLQECRRGLVELSACLVSSAAAFFEDTKLPHYCFILWCSLEPVGSSLVPVVSLYGVTVLMSHLPLPQHALGAYLQPLAASSSYSDGQ